MIQNEILCSWLHDFWKWWFHLCICNCQQLFFLRAEVMFFQRPASETLNLAANTSLQTTIRRFDAIPNPANSKIPNAEAPSKFISESISCSWASNLLAALATTHSPNLWSEEKAASDSPCLWTACVSKWQMGKIWSRIYSQMLTCQSS